MYSDRAVLPFNESLNLWLTWDYGRLWYNDGATSSVGPGRNALHQIAILRNLTLFIPGVRGKGVWKNEVGQPERHKLIKNTNFLAVALVKYDVKLSQYWPFPGLKESTLDTSGSSAEGILIVWKLRMKTTHLDGPWYRGLLYPYGDLPSQHGGQHDGETEAHHLDQKEDLPEQLH